jgi:hypothetical protein
MGGKHSPATIHESKGVYKDMKKGNKKKVV